MLARPLVGPQWLSVYCISAGVGLWGEEMLLIDDSQRNIEVALKAGWQRFIG